MNDNYTPDVDYARRCYVAGRIRDLEATGGQATDLHDEFRRFLGVVMAAAWDEGYTRGFYDSQPLPNTADASEGSSENPYEVSS